MCPRSRDSSYLVTYYIKWVTTSWTDGKLQSKYGQDFLDGHVVLYSMYTWRFPEAPARGGAGSSPHRCPGSWQRHFTFKIEENERVNNKHIKQKQRTGVQLQNMFTSVHMYS